MTPQIANLPPSRCAGCGELLIGLALGVGGCEHHRAPTAGDVTVCPECGEILLFDDSLQLQRINAEKTARLRKCRPEFYALIERHSAGVRAESRARRN